MSKIPFIQNLKDALTKRLGGYTPSDYASVDHRRQVAEARVETAASGRPKDSGYSEAVASPTPIARVEDTEVYRRAKALHDELMHAYTLENTPMAYIDERYEYGTEAGDAAIVDDAGTEALERELDEFLLAHPELERTRQFASDYPRLRQEAAQSHDGQEL